MDKYRLPVHVSLIHALAGVEIFELHREGREADLEAQMGVVVRRVCQSYPYPSFTNKMKEKFLQKYETPASWKKLWRKWKSIRASMNNVYIPLWKSIMRNGIPSGKSIDDMDAPFKVLLKARLSQKQDDEDDGDDEDDDQEDAANYGTCRDKSF